MVLFKHNLAHLSSRALANIAPDETQKLIVAVFSNPYDAEKNPDGVIFMGLAENKLMQNEISEYVNDHLTVTPHMLTYGAGPAGSIELRTALATFLNNNLHPRDSLEWSHITIMNGLTSVIDALCFCLAEHGDGILIARPTYMGFIWDFHDRAGVKPVTVAMKGADVTGLEAVKRHEEALLQAHKEGVQVKALMLCSPHNPLGKCYPPEIIEAYLTLCEKYQIHFISDEVYAKAVFPSKDVPDPLPFTSVLSLDIKKFIDPSRVHVLYGMSKDFCANGLRIGAFISPHHPTLHKTLFACAKFSWASSLSDSAWLTMLQDQKFLDPYFKKMTRRLTVAYEECVNVLRQMGVGYVASNCGHFIWIDLRHFLEEVTVKEERKLAWKMVEAGVWLGTGESFQSEEPGWFRITFALPEGEMALGIRRLRNVLREAKREFVRAHIEKEEDILIED